MTTMNGTAHSAASLDGTVERSNERGFTLAGRDGWLNFSKFAAAPTLPEPGDHVLVTCDRAGFVREVTVLSSTAAESRPTVQSSDSSSAEPAGKDRQIVRMNALGHAVALCTAGGIGANVSDVLDVAAVLERWVTR